MPVPDNIQKAYETLGLRQGASLEEVKSARKKLALRYHPDVSGGSSSRKMADINNAYAVLLDYFKNGGNVSQKAKENQHAEKRPEYHRDTRRSQENDYLSQIRKANDLINKKRYSDAMEILLSFSISMRDDYWYFLFAKASFYSNYIDDAKKAINRAIRLRPKRQSYRDFRHEVYFRKPEGGLNTLGGFFCTMLVALAVFLLFIYPSVY